MARTLAVGVLAVGVLLAFGPAAEAKEIKLSEEDASKTITASVGDVLVITLKENATTGYTWKPGKMDKSIVKFRKKETLPPKTNLMGAGTKMTMWFDVIGPGKTEFRVICRRHPHKSGDSGKTYRLTIVAEAGK